MGYTLVYETGALNNITDHYLYLSSWSNTGLHKYEVEISGIRTNVNWTRLVNYFYRGSGLYNTISSSSYEIQNTYTGGHSAWTGSAGVHNDNSGSAPSYPAGVNADYINTQHNIKITLNRPYSGRFTGIAEYATGSYHATATNKGIHFNRLYFADVGNNALWALRTWLFGATMWIDNIKVYGMD